MEPSKESGRPKRRIPRPDTGLHDLPPKVTQLPPEVTQYRPGYGPWDTGPEEIPLSASDEHTLEEHNPQYAIDRDLKPVEEATEREYQEKIRRSKIESGEIHKEE